MEEIGGRLRRAGGTPTADASSLPLVIATVFRAEGSTGVHTHVHQLRQYLSLAGTAVTLLTPFSWRRSVTYPLFAPRLVLRYVSKPASVRWYRHWHEALLHKTLRQHLAKLDDCVVYAQGPLEAHAALRARRGTNQRVVMAVHFRTSQADEHAEPGRELKRDGKTFRAIRQLERDVIPHVDGIVYVSRWAEQALVSWLPEAQAVPSAVIGNFVTPWEHDQGHETIADLVSTGKLELRKNHGFILDVLAEAKRAGRTYTLDIFGDGPLRADLEHKTRALGLEGQVNFRGIRNDVRDFLPGYRAYVHAASAETSSLAIMEAMAAGLPVIAGGIGPIPELCDDGVEGRFWPLDDRIRASQILIGLLDSEPERLMAAKAASERFSRDFDANVVAPRLVAFLAGSSAAAPAQGAGCVR